MATIPLKIAISCPKCKTTLPVLIDKITPGIEVHCDICGYDFRIRGGPPIDLMVRYADEMAAAGESMRRAYIYASQISDCLRGITILAPALRPGPKRKIGKRK